MKVLVLFLFLVAGAAAEKARFDNYRVHRVIPSNEKDLKALRDLANDNGFNLWTEPTAVNVPVDVMVPPHKRPDFQEFVKEFGLRHDVLIDNIQELINKERSGATKRVVNHTMDWTDYHSLEEFETWMEGLPKKYNKTKIVVVGKTYEKRDIKALEITFGANFRTILIESNIHAREWIAAASTSWVINEILKSPADSIWRKFNYLYVPFYNPDGYAYSYNVNRLWRKTRTPYKTANGRVCYGADPNRNWDFHWNTAGSSNDPCSEAYAGPKAFSEVETKSISQYLAANFKSKKIDVYLAFHSYSQLIMYPWGYTANPAPLKATWQRIGEAAAADLAKVDNQQFRVGDIYHIIYPSSGSSMEWYYGNFNSTINFVYELRDKGYYGFLLPPQYIIPSGKELYASIMRILTEYSKLPPKNF